MAPLLALLTLTAWAFASPVGGAPDDDFHLTSIWCASGGSEQCTEGSTPGSRMVATPLQDVDCFATLPNQSAACQISIMEGWNHDRVETDRGNFQGQYPPVYYAAMHAVAGSDLQVSAIAMRVINAALFVSLATALAMLLPVWRRPTLLWGWLVTLIPLGIFLIPSNNPSGWAITGVGIAYLALTGWFETSGHRRWALAALSLIGVVMAAGARGDSAVYVFGAMVAATIIAAPWRTFHVRTWWRWAWLPAMGALVSALFFAAAGQSQVAGGGFGGSSTSISGTGGEGGLSGFALAAYNLLMVPFLWSGVWGTWPLGSLDTGLPTVVPAAAIVAFVMATFAGIGRMDWRKGVASAGVLLVLVVLPVWVLTRGSNIVGENLQPRYLLPLIVLFALVLLTMPAGVSLAFTRLQTVVILGALAVAHLVALQVNIRRYVTGIDSQGINLDAGAEWWWAGFPVGPTMVWIIGSLAFAGMLVALWSPLSAQAAKQSEVFWPLTARTE